MQYFWKLGNNSFEALVQRLKDNIESFAIGELVLPSTELDTIANCLELDCPGKLQLNSEKMLYKMRNRPIVHAAEENALKCDKCDSCFSISHVINQTLERGFQRCFGRSKLTEEETWNLVWTQLPVKPLPDENPMELDRWLLHLSSIQLFVNQHDWKHRESCFKMAESNAVTTLLTSQVKKWLLNQFLPST